MLRTRDDGGVGQSGSTKQISHRLVYAELRRETESMIRLQRGALVAPIRFGG
jgi:hypothetical protein